MVTTPMTLNKAREVVVIHSHIMEGGCRFSSSSKEAASQVEEEAEGRRCISSGVISTKHLGHGYIYRCICILYTNNEENQLWTVRSDPRHTF
jgi:hypothetical protein